MHKLIAKLIGTVAGGLTGNVETAMSAASGAIDYNFDATLQ